MSVRLTLGLAVASALALVPLPAHAQTVTTHDAAHDVRSQGLSEDVADDPEPQRVEGDALAMRVKHSPHSVRVILRTAQLTRAQTLDAVHVFSFRTDGGRRAELSVYVAKQHWQGQRLWSVNDKMRTCLGLRSHIDYGHETVRVVVPSRCLSNPRWVRVGGGSGFLTGSKLYADDVNLDGKVGEEPRFGPRVHRG